jgi:hypothetical protein
LFTALVGGGEQAEQLTSNLVACRISIDGLNRLPERLKTSACSPALITSLHVGPFSVKNGRDVGMQIGEDRIPRW